MKYTAPTTEDLQNLRDSLGITQAEMADFVGVAGGQQWRKYTGGHNPRVMNFHMLFFVAARLALSDEEMARVLQKMRDVGAKAEI